MGLTLGKLRDAETIHGSHGGIGTYCPGCGYRFPDSAPVEGDDRQATVVCGMPHCELSSPPHDLDHIRDGGQDILWSYIEALEERLKALRRLNPHGAELAHHTDREEMLGPHA